MREAAGAGRRHSDVRIQVALRFVLARFQRNTKVTMSDASIKKEIELLGENFNEVLSSTEAVKGEAFTNAVAVNFECCQLVEAIGGLVVMARKVDAEHADTLFDMSRQILVSIAVKACGDISDDSVEEAMALAQTLNDRRLQAAKKIQQELDNDV